MVPNLATEVLTEVTSRTELKVWVKIRQPKELKAKELKVFDSLRLSMVLLVEVPAEVLVDITADITADVVMEITANVAADILAELTMELIAELRAWVKI